MKLNLITLGLVSTNSDWSANENGDWSQSLSNGLPLPPHMQATTAINAGKDELALEGDGLDESLEATLFGDYNPVGDNPFDHNPAEDNLNDNFHPTRGSFNLEAALRDSRERGYGNGVRLRFNGINKSSLDPIYMCSERTGEQCCTDKDPDCFAPGGCFCDSSCKAFDDCCPDFEETCVDKTCLDKKEPDNLQNYFRSMRMGPPQPTFNLVNQAPSIASGGQPKHVEPDACCAGKPYNQGERCCCNNQITDQCPCQPNKNN